MTPETQNVEWKRSWRDEYLAWICGFANAQGGILERGAMREAVINAVIHRDYARQTSTQIRVYHDRITIRNPAELPVNWSVSTTGEMLSEPHNPRIAHAFFRAGLIEAWGRGIHQIRERCMKAGNPTPLWIREPGGVLRLRFPFSEAYLAADAAALGVPGDSQKTAGEGTWPDNRRKAVEGSGTGPKTGLKTGPKTARNTEPMPPAERILAMLKTEPEITQPMIADRLGLTVKGVKYHFRKLREEGAIRRVGSSRAGHWEVL